jgi:hypothetical protein
MCVSFYFLPRSSSVVPVTNTQSNSSMTNTQSNSSSSSTSDSLQVPVSLAVPAASFVSADGSQTQMCQNCDLNPRRGLPELAGAAAAHPANQYCLNCEAFLCELCSARLHVAAPALRLHRSINLLPSV